jgi:5'-methylthioadenosine phosphorylase
VKERVGSGSARNDDTGSDGRGMNARTTVRAEIGVIGGSGFYRLLADVEEVRVDTPYGEPSDALSVGVVAGRRTAFVPRHGSDHRLPPHKINYRANLWALRSLGVRQILAPCAVGSLRRELVPGTIVVPDQLVDRTSGRAQTFYDQGAVHTSFADPYCEVGRTAVLKAAVEIRSKVRDGGTMVVVEGPRFSTRAESQWFAAAGWSLVNMTGHPEGVLARELAMCYTSLALVTDLDAGIDAQESVDQESVFRIFAENTERMRDLVLRSVGELPKRRSCRCSTALDGLELPFELP